MRYEPHPDEIAAIPRMSDEELLEYFLYRIFETDEVWGLKDGPQWLSRTVGEMHTLPVWPYKRYAAAAAVGDWLQLTPVVESVDFFTYQSLSKWGQQGLTVEIMPRSGAPGCLISPRRLFDTLENMMEARDYTVGD